MTDHRSPGQNRRDDSTNLSDNPGFDTVLQARLSRRRLLGGGIGAAALAMIGGGLSTACAAPAAQGAAAPGRSAAKLGFSPVAKSLADVVALPDGYRHSVLYRLGDPIAAGVGEYLNNGQDDAASFAFRGGDHHDGMHYFGLGPNGKLHKNESSRGLLCLNHEAITPAYLHPNGPTVVNGVRTVADEVLREFYAHGVGIIEAFKAGDGWRYDQDSRFNRRIHTLTEMELSGPAAKTPYMVTKYSPDGSRTRGTVNNCASGNTPWGTYLTCEENWAGYFRRIAAIDNPMRTAKELTALARYSVAGNGRERWATLTPDTPDDLYGRWNAMKLGTSADGSDDYRNGPNTYGWVVEIDPFAPASTPRKRTALGRFAHEGAWLGPVRSGAPLVWYMGCDSRNEYIYKYVSNQPWNPADADGGIKAGDKYLDDGRLYVARFDADGSGQWIELGFGLGNVTPANAAYAFADQADVVLHARLAADAAGATKMDRPEWGAVNPHNGEVYMALTNTNAASRPIDQLDAANPRFYNDRKTTGQNQLGNPNGHIIRFAEASGDAGATSFTWDVFLFGARASADAQNVNISGLTDANDFSSPDGLWFSQATGVLWIETDDGAYTDVTNCMLLAAVPGTVGDGAPRTIVSTDGVTTKAVDTYVGKQPGEENLRRFLVGPKECEITGVAETPDGKTLFINIQHPGEDTRPDFATDSFGSHWPDGGLARPRSATIVITREDGGRIGI
ncbi:PhoX family protein [Aromatoleum bremense]|uniref:DUF839 domain-containing protein n=1 Tax=Aromatoleum bremense TaxID=76115 RepID=A0ABX1NTL7_9RHOO|nr:PhoX family phosphatase [Aromatoleum bremense]NMG15131.1 DUF839 domain-containing protein [Aromatoleum bremense]QTQ31502.1 putative protein DUf839 [Aromatoleum bremense]